MDNENNTKKDLTPELPEELLDEVSGGIRYSDKGYKALGGYFGICEKYQYRYFNEPEPNRYPDDCLRCRYFRYDVRTRMPYCTYPDDYTLR